MASLFARCRDELASVELPLSLDEYYESICRDPSGFMKRVHVSANGNEDFAATAWEEIKADVAEGTLECCSLEYKVPLPSVPMVSLGEAQAKQQVTLSRDADRYAIPAFDALKTDDRMPSCHNRVGMRFVTRMPPALMGDCFEVVVVVSAEPVSSSPLACSVVISGQVNFLSSTWMRSMIESNAVKGYTSYYATWASEMQALAADVCAARVRPVTPPPAPVEMLTTRSAPVSAESVRSSVRRRRPIGLLLLLETPKPCEELILRASGRLMRDGDGSSTPARRRGSSRSSSASSSTSFHSAAAAAAAAQGGDIAAQVDADAALAAQAAEAEMPVRRTPSPKAGAAAPSQQEAPTQSASWSSAFFRLIQPVADVVSRSITMISSWAAPAPAAEPARAPAAATSLQLAGRMPKQTLTSLAQSLPLVVTLNADAVTIANSHSDSQKLPSYLAFLLMTPRPAAVAMLAVGQLIVVVSFFIFKDLSWA